MEIGAVVIMESLDACCAADCWLGRNYSLAGPDKLSAEEATEGMVAACYSTNGPLAHCSCFRMDQLVLVHLWAMSAQLMPIGWTSLVSDPGSITTAHHFNCCRYHFAFYKIIIKKLANISVIFFLSRYFFIIF